MRNLLFAFLFFCSLDAFAQKEPKIDSVYYLIDTAKTPVNARMWVFDNDGPIRYYVLKCPCLKNNGQPIFLFDNRTTKSTNISRKEILAISLVNLPDLILKVKEYIDNNYKRRYAFFLIEPIGETFKVYKVRADRQTAFVY